MVLVKTGGGGCKKNKLTIGVCAIAVLLSFAAPVLADTPTPTLDAIKATQSAYLTGTHPSYTLTKIIEDATAPKDSITVKIDGTSYYYTPSDNTEVLQSLASTGSVALEVTTDPSKALYSVGDTYYTYNSDKLKGSGYNLTEAASADEPNTITLYDKTEVIKYYDPTTGAEVAAGDRVEGVEYKEVSTIETTPKYYTVNLNKTAYGDPNGTKPLTYGWEKTKNGKLEFKEKPTTPVGQTITYSYNPDSFSKTVTNTSNPTVTDPANTSSSSPYIIEGGAGLNNPEGSTSSINNELYIGNKVTGTLESTSRPYKYAQVSGGAVYNAGELTSVTGAFINNSVEAYRTGSYSSYARNYAYGGALYNSGTIGDITADFIGNYASGNSYALGGAIYNNDDAEIGDITGDFIGNYASGNNYASGGAIDNVRTIGDITGDFIGNYASSTNSLAYGGAIYNDDDAEIGDITGDFIGNYASGNSSAGGGAIYNNGTIGNITGDFIGNYAFLTGSYASGGAIYNDGTIGDITGDFIGNYASSTFSSASGGAIYNSGGTIGDITGDFIGNYASGYYAEGGAIYNNRGTIGDITGDFIGNYASGSSAYGGAIYNDYDAEIGDITGDFIGNYATDSYQAFGGAIYNDDDAEIGDITGDFIGNYATGSYQAFGGAIYNDDDAEIGDITGDFIGNYASSTDQDANGGAIYNTGTIGNITGDFIGNYASGGASVSGGAIFNSGTIGNITGDFIGNYAQSETGNALGGAIYNEEIINTIVNSDFIDNYAVSENGEAKGGAIYTTQDLNIAAQDGGQSVFSGNYTESNGVKTPNAIYVEGGQPSSSMQTTIVSIDIDKIIYQESNFDNEDFPTLTLDTNTNGVIRFDDQISGTDANLNTYQMNIIGMAQDFENKEQIYQMLGLSDDATVSEVIDAYIAFMQQQYPDEELPENIKEQILQQFIDMGAVETTDPEFISGEAKGSYDLKITGDSTGKVILNNDVINANISLDNTNLYLGREDVFDKSVSLSLNSGSIYLNNQSVGTMHVPTLNLNGNTNISVDADLANKSMDRITADNYNVKDNAMLNVNNIVLLSDAKEDKTNILFADEGLASNVAYTGASPIAYTPIYKYEVSYNPDDGFFTFARSAGSSGPNGNISDSFNPSVLASQVATQAGAYTTQLQTFNYAFQHADTFMNIPYLERVAIINSGKYALSPTGDATDVGTYSPLMIKQHDPGFWVKPYASFENVPLKNGPKVSNINYGTLIGYDSPLKTISHGFERVLTGYIGYNGASQRYQGVDAYQNGGLIGGTATFYKGNFFNATTLSVGATAGDASTMYGSENYTMLLAGIGNKTGYNFEFWDGKMILQPNFLISYTFVNTFDYNNAAGVRIESDPLHAIQLSPGLKLIGNTKNGWQPYIGVNMVWNLLDDSRVTANDVRLPEMSIRPYVQYGVGVQKRFKDKFLAFGQAMIHNGGRNGVSLTVGLRWKVGRE